jgi:[protein-PII] uridylyltransferase
MLYLLTFADVRAVGPDVWSQWKGALFQELYFKALTVLERGTFDIEEAGSRIERIKERVLELTESEGIGVQTVDDFFELLPQRYFLSNSHELIAGHIKTLGELGTKPYIMNVRQDSYREYTELVICTNDLHGLFSRITGVLTANGINILGAQINTMKNGIALDILQIRNNLGSAIIDEHRVRKIDSELSMVLSGKTKVEDLVSKRSRPSILDKKAKPVVSARVEVDNEVSDTYTVLDIHARNRIGLLYDITSTLSGLGLYIHIAKISTKGDIASDIFYVRDIFGQKIYYKKRLKEISKALADAIRDNPVN